MMKKIIVTSIIVAAFSITLMACTSSNPSQTQEQMPATDHTTAGDATLTVTSVDENIDPYDLKDGTYHVSVDFSEMTNHNGNVVLDFGIFSPVHYDKDEIEGLKEGQSLHVHWGEAEDESRSIEVETIEFKENYVTINGGMDSDGIDLILDDSGYYRIIRESDATYYTCHGYVGLEVPETVNLEDSYATPGETRTIKGNELYDYFYSLSDDEKSHFTQNCTFLTVKDGVITEFYRVYVP